MSPKDHPPSSFPGIWKIPSGFGAQSGADWISGKRKDDNIGNLWRVHNKLYDLTPFLPIHPGGQEWLEITQGTDITEAFETCHMVNIALVEHNLAKYFVSDATQPRLSPYTFEENGFFKTLKRRAAPILKEKGTGPTKQMKFFQDWFVALYVICGIIGTWKSILVLKLISGSILGLSLIGAHNFSHIKMNWRRIYYDFGLISYHEWRITHALSHHLYPNTLLDYELFLYPTFKFLPNQSRNSIQKYGPAVYSHFLYLVTFWLDFGKRIYNASSGKQSWRKENNIVLIHLGILILVAPSAMNGLLSWIIIHSASSFTFLTIAATGAHHHPKIFHDGDEARADPDFGLCQLDATRDRAGEVYHTNVMVLLTFGEHCLHHLFPTVCHSKLHHLQQVYEETLKDFSESFVPVPQWKMTIGCYQQLARTQSNSFNDYNKKLN